MIVSPKQTIKDAEIRNIMRFTQFIQGGYQAVSCYTPDGTYRYTYPSLRHAAKAVDAQSTRIRQNIEEKRLTPKTGKRSCVGGYYWEWETDARRIATCQVIF